MTKRLISVLMVLVLALGMLVLTAHAATKVSITTQPKNAAAPSGSVAKTTVKASGDGLTYKWYFKDKGDSKFAYTSSFKTNTYSLKMNSFRNGRQVYCVVADKYGNTVKTKTVTLYMGNPAKITTQPKNAAAPNGSTAKVTVKASGDGLTYKWYFKNKGDSKFTYTSSFKSNTYSLSMNTSRSGRQVYCVITDKYGTSVKTNTVTLYKGNPAKITTQPKNAAAPNGSTAKVTVKASGDGLTYKWYFKNKGDSKFTYTSSFKSNTYSLSMNTARSGRQVYCVITDKYGTSVKTNTVTLYKGNPAKITTQPKNVAVDNGSTAKVTLKATGDGLTYKWYYKNKGDSKFTYTSSFSTNVYSLKMNSARNGRQVYCVITDKYGTSVKSKTVTLSMRPYFTTQPKSVYVGMGESATLTAKAGGGTAPYTYKWYRTADFDDWDEDELIGTGASVTIDSAFNYTSDYEFYCVVTDAAGDGKISDYVWLMAKVHLYNQSEPKTYCQIGKPLELYVSAGGGKEPYTYTWEYTFDGLGYYDTIDWRLDEDYKGYETGDLTIVEVLQKDIDDHLTFRCTVKDARGDTVTSKEITLFEAMKITGVKSKATVNVGDTVTITPTVSGGVAPYTYQWYTTHEYNVDRVYLNSTASKLTVTVTEEMWEKEFKFTCVVTDANGEYVSASTKLVPLPKITRQPIFHSGVKPGDEVIFYVVADGKGPFTYQWQWQDLTTGEFHNFTGDSGVFSGVDTFMLATNARYDTDMNHRMFRCVVTDANGNTVTSNVGFYLMNMTATVYGGGSYELGDTVWITAMAMGGKEPYTYQWMYKWEYMSKFEVSSYTDNSFVLEVNAMHKQAKCYYYCIITDNAGNTYTTEIVCVWVE